MQAQLHSCPACRFCYFSALTTLENHFLLMASLDYQKHELDQLSHLLDELVDMTITITHQQN